MGYNQHTFKHLDLERDLGPGSEPDLSIDILMQSLREYDQIDPSENADGDQWWVPVSVLYGVYRRTYHNSARPYPGDPDPVIFPVQQFGIILRRLWPEAIPVERTWQRGKRRLRGLAGISGPLCQKAILIGRPPKMERIDPE